MRFYHLFFEGEWVDDGLRDGHLRVRGWVKVPGDVEGGQALGLREDDSGGGVL